MRDESLFHSCLAMVALLFCISCSSPPLPRAKGAEESHACLQGSLKPCCTEKQPQKTRAYHTDLTVVGNVRLADSLGKQSVDLIESLKDSMSISFVSTRRIAPVDMQSCPEALAKILKTSGRTHSGKVLIFEDMLTRRPDKELIGDFWSKYKLKKSAKDQIRFAYSMFESSLVPKSWVTILNTCFDAVLVPDEFLVKVYRDSGVVLPMFVIPLGRDLKEFVSAPIKKDRGHPFVFANFSYCAPRKNLLKLIQAFDTAFGNNPDVQLLLCWRSFSTKTRETLFSEIAARGLENVKIEERAVDGKTYLQRFLGVDCYVNIATGEGFSIQPREAMALGIPTIVTNNTGQKTICASGLARAVPSDIEVPAQYFFPGDFGVQYQCRIEDVVEALQDVYSQYALYLQRSEKAREWAAQYRYEQLAWMYKSLIIPKKILLGAEDRVVQDGVMTSSKALYKKYRKIFRK